MNICISKEVFLLDFQNKSIFAKNILLRIEQKNEPTEKTEKNTYSP